MYWQAEPRAYAVAKVILLEEVLMKKNILLSKVFLTLISLQSLVYADAVSAASADPRDINSTAYTLDDNEKIKKVNELKQVYTAKWKADFLFDYHKLISDIPNPEKMARDLMKAEFPHLDPDKTYYAIFDIYRERYRGLPYFTFAGSSLADVMTLTHAALTNAPAKAGFSYSDYYNFSAIYNSYTPGAKWYPIGLEEENSRIYDVIYKADLQAQYTNKIEKYWSDHYQRYIDVHRKAFELWAFEAFENLEISDTSYELARSVLANDNNYNAFKFDIYGYFSNDMLWIESLDGRLGLLYTPGAMYPFISFENIQQMRDYLVRKVQNEEDLTGLGNHFSLYDRQDGVIYSGVNKLLVDWAKWGTTYILSKKEKITTDVFTYMAEATKAREISDGDTLIKSNAEVRADKALRGINAALNFLPILDIIAPEIGIPLSLAINVTALGLNVAVTGDTENERIDGTFGTVSSSMYLASAAIIPPIIEHAPYIEQSANRLLADEELSLVHLRNEKGIPLIHENIRVGEVHEFTHPITKQPAKVVRLSDDYRLVAIAEDQSGVFKEIEFSSGKIISERKILQEGGSWRNEITPVCPHV